MGRPCAPAAKALAARRLQVRLWHSQTGCSTFVSGAAHLCRAQRTCVWRTISVVPAADTDTHAGPVIEQMRAQEEEAVDVRAERRRREAAEKEKAELPLDPHGYASAVVLRDLHSALLAAAEGLQLKAPVCSLLRICPLGAFFAGNPVDWGTTM